MDAFRDHRDPRDVGSTCVLLMRHAGRRINSTADELVATHYLFYSTIVGVGILIGNLAVGSLMDVASRLDSDEILWGGLILVGLAAAAGLYPLGRPAVRAAAQLTA